MEWIIISNLFKIELIFPIFLGNRFQSNFYKTPLNIKIYFDVAHCSVTFRSRNILYNYVKYLFDIPFYIIKYAIHPQTIFNFNTSCDRLNVQTYFPGNIFNVNWGKNNFRSAINIDYMLNHKRFVSQCRSLYKECKLFKFKESRDHRKLLNGLMTIRIAFKMYSLSVAVFHWFILRNSTY